MHYKNKIDYTSETFSVLRNLASHEEFHYDASLASAGDVSAFDVLKQIQDACWNVIENKEDVKRYFCDYGKNTLCLANVLCGKDTMISSSFEQIRANCRTMDLKERLSFLSAEEKTEEAMICAFMELLDSTDLDPSEKFFQIHALFEAKRHCEIIFHMFDAVEKELRAHSEDLEKIYLSRRKELRIFDVKQWMKTNRMFEFDDALDELLRTNVQISLFDPFTLKVSADGCELGAYIMLSNENSLETQRQTVLRYSRIFSDESKLNILKILSNEKLMNRELAEKTGLTSATISHHMSVLTQAQLVKATVSKNKVLYEINEKKLHEILVIINQYFQ